MVKESDIRAIDDEQDDNEEEDVQSMASSSSNSMSMSSSRTGAKTATSMEEVLPMLARGETKAVRRLRWLTLLVLLLVATASCAAVFIYTRNAEETAFSEEFVSSGSKVITAFQDDSYRKMEALHSLSSSVTAYALNQNLTWPFVTLENSARILEPYLSLVDAAAITILPIVPADQRAEWEAYSVQEQGWIQKDLEARKDMKIEDAESSSSAAAVSSGGRSLQGKESDYDGTITPYIKNYVGIDVSPGPWYVWWQYAPVIPNTYFVNVNRLALQSFADLIFHVMEGNAVISPSWTVELGLDEQSARDYFFVNEMLEAGSQQTYEAGEPLSYIYYPVFETFASGVRKIVAVLESTVYWHSYFEYILPEKVRGVVVVVKNSHNDSFTYQLNGKDAVFLGMGDYHSTEYEHMMLRADYTAFQDAAVEAEVDRDYVGVPVDDEYMSYWIEVYPSAEMESIYLTNRPLAYTLAMVFIFSITRIVLTSAMKSNAVVASMFPKNVRDRLLDNAGGISIDPRKGEEFALDEKEGLIPKTMRSMPIADFFPETTIFFADIQGFTAWCSTREPAQVFALLETIYNAFDEIAKRRRVFKVETVGDCYMAVCGVPDPRKEHAVVMARFARDCMARFNELVRKLEVSLGPDTADLSIRAGMHSGPVTGGVIRGENARFQLFGDTVNTAARMESTGLGSHIQLSQETADQLIHFGKGRWLVPREDEVVAKGKGVMKTFWLRISEAPNSTDARSSAFSSQESTSDGDMQRIDLDDNLESQPVVVQTDEKNDRLVSWNVDLLLNLLKEIVARREVLGEKKVSLSHIEKSVRKAALSENRRPIEEVREIISLPHYDAKAAAAQKAAPSAVTLDPRVVEQLHSYVQCLAAMYRNNPFHNFEHASHVTMSVSKLLARIVKPANVKDDAKGTHDHTYGITSDPLTQFSCVLAALIHDVDHPGVPNAQLVKEGSKIAEFYQGKSVAEQNSVDLAWELLMDGDYAQLRAAIYGNEKEMKRFRALVVNTVMATDIVDKDLKALRNARWELAFSEGATDSNSKDAVDRKATIVMEHLIQASDVAHTMQHWHIYRKWNERFFMECYKAYKTGRAAVDPSESWYKGEIGFFDFYIIPLAKKLKDCGVFGVSSDEYLNYAMRNRKEWEEKGQEVVAEMIRKAEKEFADVATEHPVEALTAVSQTRSVHFSPSSISPSKESFLSDRLFL